MGLPPLPLIVASAVGLVEFWNVLLCISNCTFQKWREITGLTSLQGAVYVTEELMTSRNNKSISRLVSPAEQHSPKPWPCRGSRNVELLVARYNTKVLSVFTICELIHAAKPARSHELISRIANYRGPLQTAETKISKDRIRQGNSTLRQIRATRLFFTSTQIYPRPAPESWAYVTCTDNSNHDRFFPGPLNFH